MKRTLILLLTIVSLGLQAQTWTNPLTLDNEWSLYGIGDPYIMKYRGTYYLYCSTKDNNIGVKCWATKDFITWSDAYTCTTEAVTKTAYAPEVVYWNGKFYMYTSPGGNGHYVLSSDSPTGPFTLVTGNLGKVIDGSVFIEDNGQWYFYHADGNGIKGCAMSSPTSIGASVDLNASMLNNWTEGPTVIKRNGVYYLIYTGNHVISKGYRIDYATNTTGAISSYSPQSNQNPILLKSEGSFVGLGHGSAFIGPDLDSYYYTYHNLAGDYGVGPYRRLNFDRIAWNGNKLLLLGPTTWAQQAFKQADRSDFFDRNETGTNWLMPDGGNWTIQEQDRLVQELNDKEYKALFNPPTGSDYIAEFTVKGENGDSEDARFGAIFGYTDEANYGIAVLRSQTNQLEINFKTNNTWDTPRYCDLPAGYKLNVWHSLRMEKSGTTYRFFIDGMQKAVITNSLDGGKIGYVTDRCRASFGYIAFNNKTGGTEILDIYKPVPGIIAAVHYTEGSENTETDACGEGGSAITNNRAGQKYTYNINVKANGLYSLGLRYAADDTGTRIRILQGDTDLTGVVALPSTNRANNYQTFTVKGLELSEGLQTLTVETVAGNFNFYEMRLEEADNSVVTLSDTFNTAFSPDWNYTDGNWRIVSGEADINGHGKRTLGSTGWTDYTVQVDVTYFDAFNGGLIFRVNNPALGGAGNDPAAGTDFMQAYFVSLSSNGIILGKHNYNWTLLTSKSGSYTTNKKYTLRVEVKGANIKVYVDNRIAPEIDYTDSRPFICGKVGLRVCSAHIRFDNFSVTTHDDKNSLGTQPLMGWSSWNANRVHINEALIKETADSIVSLGLKNYGYNWVNIDDGFFNGRNEQGVLQVNSKFPNGMKTVSDYIHSKGLNAGIYSDAGRNTCASIHEGDHAGSNSCLYGHEEQDLRLFFDTWNYDFIKVDYCGGIELGLNEQTAYTNIGNIIKNLKTELGRDLHYNICRWSFPGTWAASVADSWRISGDIWDNFASIAEIIDLNTYLAPYCSQGHFNDMDMLQVGRGLSVEEEKTHFAMWSIMNSPLVIGCNFRDIRPSTVEILKNAEIIAVNQDPLCLQAEVVAANGKTKVFAKTIEQLHGKVRAVALYNPTYTAKTIRVNFADIHLSSKAKVRDLWQHRDLGEFTGFYETIVPAHGTAILRIEGDAAIDQLRYQGEYAYMNKFAAIHLAENARFSKITHFTTSGGAIMEWLGNSPDNYAEYRDVYVQRGGNYTFKLYYISAENRNLQVIVNGVEHTMTGLNSGGWDKRATAEIQIPLNAGSNVIRLANATAMAPNIDKFELIPEGATATPDPFDFDPSNQVDDDAAFPKISSLDNSNEYWYYILFKENEFVLQDMGENDFLLTKYLDENRTAQKWKIVETGDKGDFKYRIISADGRSLQRVSASETTDGFYKTTSSESAWERFRIVATNHSGLKPAWEIERNGANNRRLNQYNPQQVYGPDKKISEWEANDHGNSVIFVPAGTSSAIKTVQNASSAKVYTEGNRVWVEGENIQNVSLFTVNGSLAGKKGEDPFSFLLNTAGCYLAVIKYKNNYTETIKVIL